MVDDAGEATTYAQLNALVDTAATALRGGAGRTMGLLSCGNDRASLVAYLACLRAQAVPLLLPPSLAPALKDALMAAYQPDWVLGPSEHGEPLPGSGLRLQRLAGGGAEPHPDLALLLSTSGSTGSPRLVRLSHAALEANAASIANFLAIGPAERAITTLPPHYSYGLSVINSHLRAGACVVLTEHSVLRNEFWNLARSQCATSLAGVPYTYQLLHRTGFADRDLPTLHTLTQAGGRLDDRLTHFFHELAVKRGWRFFVMYGQTEATARISYVPPERLGEKVGSIGLPIPGGALALDGDSGEMIYRGPNVMMGYAQTREDLARGDELQGVLRTGELGRADEEGFFYVTGRQKRFVKLSGSRIGLDEVENMLQEELGVPVAVGGRDDALVAWIETRDDALPAQAARLFKERYGFHHSHYRLARVDQLPLLPSGKKDYAPLLAPA